MPQGRDIENKVGLCLHFHCGAIDDEPASTPARPSARRLLMTGRLSPRRRKMPERSSLQLPKTHAQMLRRLGRALVVESNGVNLMRFKTSSVERDDERNDMVPIKKEGQRRHIPNTRILTQQLLDNGCVRFNGKSTVLGRSNAKPFSNALDEGRDLARRRADARPTFTKSFETCGL
eukprot:452677-Pleurochrysis_carterae.AAC.1